MSAVFPMRYIFAFAGAVLITLSVFLFMQGLIEKGRDDSTQLIAYTPVEVFHPSQKDPEPQQQEIEPEDAPEQPLMDALDVPSPIAPTPELAEKLELPSLDLALGDFEVSAVGDNWAAPLGAAGVPVAGSGDALGYVEVIPFNTRRPNVPEVAWQNKVNGWVLVAFSITPEGSTTNVRVLDASPRGVFEEKVVAAVKDWQYQLNYSAKAQGEIILTQKVEVQWRNYPQNIPNVD